MNKHHTENELVELEGDVWPHPMVLTNQGVLPMTWTQLCNSWWNCCALALTSSAINKLIMTDVYIDNTIALIVYVKGSDNVKRMEQGTRLVIHCVASKRHEK